MFVAMIHIIIIIKFLKGSLSALFWNDKDVMFKCTLSLSDTKYFSINKYK